MYTITLLKKELIARDTMAFHFSKPDGFTYRAGQYADYTLKNPPETDSEGDKRTFSFASSPFEPDLMIATRLRDTAFKRVLKNMPEGTELTMEGPFGSLVLPKSSDKPAVFLTGGVGATLVRSMVAEATHDTIDQKILFLYSDRTPETAVFLNEFTALAEQNKNFTFVPTMTDAGDQPWDGARGPIDLEMLKKYLSNITNAIYFLSGTGEMVGAMRRMLMAAGVERTSIRSDLFVGY
jgi:ferredoxin-NADP reductase